MNEDLKWLATNKHEWNEHQLWCWIVLDTNGDRYISFVNFDDPSGEKAIYRNQWQAARDELSGKPSWDSVPRWAEWTAQSPVGHWECYAEKPESDDEKWVHSCRGQCVDFAKYKGRVLGDWRNTLERRPCVPESAKSDTQEVLSKADDKQWRGPEDGLPPVGMECEYAAAMGEDFEPCIFIGFVRGECYVLRHLDSPTSVDRFMSNDPGRFRHLRTEEDKAVEEMIAIAAGKCGNNGLTRAAMIAPYAAGYRKQESK